MTKDITNNVKTLIVFLIGLIVIISAIAVPTIGLVITLILCSSAVSYIVWAIAEAFVEEFWS